MSKKVAKVAFIVVGGTAGGILAIYAMAFGILLVSCMRIGYCGG